MSIPTRVMQRFPSTFVPLKIILRSRAKKSDEDFSSHMSGMSADILLADDLLVRINRRIRSRGDFGPDFGTRSFTKSEFSKRNRAGRTGIKNREKGARPRSSSGHGPACSRKSRIISPTRLKITKSIRRVDRHGKGKSEPHKRFVRRIVER